MTVVYGKRSQAAYDTLDPQIQRVLLYIKNVLKIDHSILEGFRNKETQNGYYYATPQRSHVKWPNGKHNCFPSKAVDVVPFVKIPGRRGGIHWHDKDPKIKELYYREMVRFAAIFQMVALLKFDLVLRWGGDWNKDWSVMDNKFNDYPHHEMAA